MNAIRDVTTELAGSVMGFPVFWSQPSTSATDARGCACLWTAHAPATWAAASDVPASLAKPPSGTDEVMSEPGASRDRSEALFEEAST